MRNCDHHEKEEEWMNGWQSFVVRNFFETHTIKNFHTDSGTIRLFNSYIICITISTVDSINIFNHFTQYIQSFQHGQTVINPFLNMFEG